MLTVFHYPVDKQSHIIFVAIENPPFVIYVIKIDIRI